MTLVAEKNQQSAEGRSEERLSKEYLGDPDTVTNILVTTVSERKLKEEFEKAERLKQLEYEESGKIRGHELELARIKTTLPVSGESQNTVISGAKKKFNLPKLKGSLGYEEFKRAEVLVFKLFLQSNAFQDERLFAKRQAFKDEDGLLRIRTKLADSYEKEDFKFPILLPANDVVVKLIREKHVKAMHAAMFIHGNSNCETPDLDQVDRSSLVKRTKYLQKLRENLRQRFRNEYLALLVHRGIRRNDALEMGDVVLIGHDNVQRIDWPLGVVLEVYPGKDGVPREKDSLPVQKTPESSTNHVSESLTDYVPDSPVESTDNSKEKPPTKTRLGRTIRIPRKLDL
ncbi:DUF5641 domain-containing protein [Trichonephila clavata]|uniref:DUF5641 domain-containing protein n=1 Tax=Trichonephila clavata TaxID=2740835 RepID=A0A8X6IKJ4_TRICU|nr:DUF5641 domain-containing protein [Trichonephila clavata]